MAQFEFGSINLALYQLDAVADDWADQMATCEAHLRSALSVIEDLPFHAGVLPSDSYFYDQASACLWVALVALAQCGPDATRRETN